MTHFSMLMTNSGRLQREFAEIGQRANVVRRLLQQCGSTRPQDTSGVEEAIQVAEKIEALVCLAQNDPSVNSRKIWHMITRLRNDLQSRIDQLNDPEIDGAV